jgi:hypothetical protein
MDAFILISLSLGTTVLFYGQSDNWFVFILKRLDETNLF